MDKIEEEPSWVQQQLSNNRDFSAGWNSALWEVRRLLFHGPVEPEDIEALVNHIDK